MHSTAVCSANLGSNEPGRYLDNYIVDERCPVTDMETKIGYIEERFCLYMQ